MNKILQIFLLLFFPLSVFSQTHTYNEEFQVNAYAQGYQGSHAIANLINQKVVICWTSDNQDGDGYGIYAKLYDENLSEIGSEFQINSYAQNDQMNPAVEGLNNGGFVVCWESRYQDGSDKGVFARIFNENGIAISDEIQINSYVLHNQANPSVCAVGDSSFVICWQSGGQDGSGSGIYAQLFNSDGTKIGDEFLVNSYSEYNQQAPEICSFNNGNFVICWVSSDQDGEGSGIFAQVFNEEGLRLGNEFQVNSYFEDDQTAPSISSLKNGGFIICWQSYYNWADIIRSQIYDENASPVGNEFTAIVTNERCLNPSVEGLENGGFVICCETSFDIPWSQGIAGQLFAENGSKIGSLFRVNSEIQNYQSDAIISNLSNGNFIISWQSDELDGGDSEIHAKYFLPIPTHQNLSDFNLITPPQNITITQNHSVFNWESASDVRINFPWEITYDFYIDTDSNFSNPRIESRIPDTMHQRYFLDQETYFWKVLANDYLGDSLWSSTIFSFTFDPNVTTITEFKSAIPIDFILHQNYPNPFNPTTKIKFSIPLIVGNEDFRSLLKVYDILGNEITTLVNEQKPPGAYEVEFSAEDFGLTSGIYFYQLTVGQFSDTRKMLLIK
jgi:hypothetical protein